MAVTIKRLFYRGVSSSGGATDAINVNYDNTDSGLSANNVQDAIDEIVAEGVNYSATFAILDWSGPTVDSTYSISVPFTTHNKTNPIIQVFELVGSDYIEVEVTITISSNNVILDVPSIPDLRFDGKITIS